MDKAEWEQLFTLMSRAVTAEENGDKGTIQDKVQQHGTRYTVETFCDLFLDEEE